MSECRSLHPHLGSISESAYLRECQNVAPLQWLERDYCAETREVQKFLAAKGFAVPSVASDFFSDFYGVKVRLRIGLIEFEVHREVVYFGAGDQTYLHALADAPLRPIGLIWRGGILRVEGCPMEADGFVRFYPRDSLIEPIIEGGSAPSTGKGWAVSAGSVNRKVEPRLISDSAQRRPP